MAVNLLGNRGETKPLGGKGSRGGFLGLYASVVRGGVVHPGDQAFYISGPTGEDVD